MFHYEFRRANSEQIIAAAILTFSESIPLEYKVLFGIIILSEMRGIRFSDIPLIRYLKE